MTECGESVIERNEAESVLAQFQVELERHHLRRGAGIPTISVLVGPPGTAVSLWRQWSRDQGRPVLVANHTDQSQIVQQWLACASANCGLDEAALAWLAESGGRHVSELEESLSGKTKHERHVVLQRILERCEARDAAELCQWILDRSEHEPADAKRFADALSMLFTGREDPAMSCLAALTRLMPTNASPTLILGSKDDASGASTWIHAASRIVTRIAEGVPNLPIALAIPAADFRQYVELAEESRRIAMLRESVVRLDRLKAGAIRWNIEKTIGDMAACMEDSIHRLLRDGCSDELARAFTDAASAVLLDDRMNTFGHRERSLNDDRARTEGSRGIAAETAPTSTARSSEEKSNVRPSQADDEARSAVERFLFERLQSLPETAGHFELNGKLPAEFGPAGEAEVDLLGRQLLMGIEIDGYYHFQDPDCYRRDRRKDLALQKKDYLIVRVLAEDVVTRLDATLDVILDAVSFRRARLRGGT